MNGGDPKEREAKLLVAAEAVRTAEQRAVAGQLALEMMHEVKNPLEALGHLTYLAYADAHDPEKVRRYMTLAEEQMTMLRSLASQTLGFARPSQSPRSTEFLPLTEAALRLHQRAIDSKRIRLIKQLSENVLAEVHSGEMLQVLSNLIVNAVDALPTAGTLTLRLKKSRDMVHFIIADNGHGIEAKDFDRIFQPFFSTKEDRGNGLGLSLSKKIIDRHSGTIRMRSSVRPGRSGTIFRISVPSKSLTKAA